MPIRDTFTYPSFDKFEGSDVYYTTTNHPSRGSYVVGKKNEKLFGVCSRRAVGREFVSNSEVYRRFNDELLTRRFRACVAYLILEEHRCRCSNRTEDTFP